MEEESQSTFASRCHNFWRNHWKGIVSIIIPFAVLPILFIDLQSKVYRCLYLYCLCSLYWATNAVPIYVVGLFPAMLLPIMGITDSKKACVLYFNDNIVLFVGSMMLGLAIVQCKLHRRIALSIMSRVGSSPANINLALICTSAFISMWITSIPTTLMMCSVVDDILKDLEAQGVVKSYEDQVTNDKPKPSWTAIGFYLSVAFAATIGGTGTLLGSPTNIAFKAIYDIRFPKSDEYTSYPRFSGYTLFLVVLLILFLCVWMHLIFMRSVKFNLIREKLIKANDSIVQTNYKELGGFTMHEFQVLLLLFIMILLFLTMRPAIFTGYADFLNDKYIKNSWPVIVVGLLLLMIPAHYRCFNYISGSPPYTKKDTPALLSFTFMIRNMPWGLQYLMGGGILLTKGIMDSGMSKSLISSFKQFDFIQPWILQFLCIVVVLFFAAFISNVAVCNMLIPLIAELAIACNIHPMYLIFPAGLATTYSFILPIIDSAQDVSFKYANIPLKYLFLAGIGPTIAAMFLVFLNGQLWHQLIFPDNDTYPSWGNK